MRDGAGFTEELRSGRFRAHLPRALAKQAAGKPIAETFDTRGEADGWRSTMVDRLRADLKDKSGTLDEFGLGVLKRRSEAKLVSAISDSGRWAHVQASDLGGMQLKRIEPKHVDEFAQWLAKRRKTVCAPGGMRVETNKPLSRQTQVHIMNLLRTVFDRAVIAGHLTVNPAALITPESSEDGEDLGDFTWLTLSEIKQLLSCTAIPAEIRDIYTVAIYTGLRQGEIWALRWEVVRLDGERPQVTVAKSNKRRTTKTKKIRSVPLLPQALTALQRQHVRLGRPTMGLVFPRADGRQRPGSSDARWACQKKGLRKGGPLKGQPYIHVGYRKRACIRDEVRFHDMRHTCASHLVQGSWGRKWRLEDAREFLGHASITTTQRYAHLDPDHLHEAAAATRIVRSGSDRAEQVAVHQGPTGTFFEPIDQDQPATAPKNDLTSGNHNDGDAPYKPRVTGSSPVAPTDGKTVKNQEVRGAVRGAVTGQAQAVLALTAAGADVPNVLLSGMADWVLKNAHILVQAGQPEAVRLALDVMAGGDHRLRHAIGLAGCILADEQAACGTKTA